VGLNSGTVVIGQSGLHVNISGQPVTTSVSGQPVGLVSGAVVGLSGLQVIVQSGLLVIVQSGLQVFAQSGLHVVTAPASAVRARPVKLINNNSGGETLVSGGVISLILRSLDGDVYVGGSEGTEYPYSGYGLLMRQHDAVSFDVDNFNRVNVFAATSGHRVSYAGQDR
jgi:hypothetical protein